MGDFGWEYPPGCTGNEPEIAGYDEIEIVAECSAFECDFEGNVEAYGHDGIFYWDCPLCESENEFTVEDDRDYDKEDLYPSDYEYSLDEVW